MSDWYMSIVGFIAGAGLMTAILGRIEARTNRRLLASHREYTASMFASYERQLSMLTSELVDRLPGPRP